MQKNQERFLLTPPMLPILADFSGNRVTPRERGCRRITPNSEEVGFLQTVFCCLISVMLMKGHCISVSNAEYVHNPILDCKASASFCDPLKLIPLLGVCDIDKKSQYLFFDNDRRYFAECVIVLVS